MSEYKKRFDQWQKEARDRIEDLDDQLGIKEKIGTGVKVAKKTASKGSETIKDGVGKIKEEAGKSETGKRAVKVVEDAYETAGDRFGSAKEKTKRAKVEAKKSAETMRDVASDASNNAGDIYESASVNVEVIFNTTMEKAGEVFEQTKRSTNATARNVSKTLGFGMRWGQTLNSSRKTLKRTTGWVKEQPVQAAATGASIVVGAGLGVLVTGVSSHWFFNSSVPVWSIKKASEYYQEQLKDREFLAERDDIDADEYSRLEFERKIAKYVGAPLLGAYSFASGAVLMSNIFNPKTITGAPLSWLIGGNPLIEGVWFFGNGLICFKTSFDFFMIALEDHDDIQKIVKEIKGNYMPEQGNEA